MPPQTPERWSQPYAHDFNTGRVHGSFAKDYNKLIRLVNVKEELYCAEFEYSIRGREVLPMTVYLADPSPISCLNEILIKTDRQIRVNPPQFLLGSSVTSKVFAKTKV